MHESYPFYSSNSVIDICGLFKNAANVHLTQLSVSGSIQLHLILAQQMCNRLGQDSLMKLGQAALSVIWDLLILL